MAKDFLSDVDFKSTVTLTSTDAGSEAGPIIELYRNSASPADADYIGQIKFQGENDNDQKVIYAKITGKIDDMTDTTEDGIIEFMLRKAGSNNIAARFTSDALKLINSTGLEVGDGLLTLGSTAITATAAEINVVDGVTAGTVTASKALVVDANKDIASLRNATFTGTLTLDSVGISAIQTSGESFADNDTSLMTSAAIDDRINAAGGSPAGSDTEVQFNNSGSFGSSSNMVFDGTRLKLTNSDDVDLDAISGALITGGDGTGQHLAFNGNEIMSKTDGTTAGSLYIQNNGGNVEFGDITSLTEWAVYGGTNKFYSSAAILQLHNESSATTGGYLGYYSSDGTRLGYVGYPANDDLYIKQEDGDGDIYIESDNGRIYYFADTYHFWKVGGVYELRLDGSYLMPYTNEGLQLGASGKAWDKFWLGQGSTFSSGGYWTLRSRDSDRQVMEYVSSERYKKDIVDLPVSEAYEILNARPIKFRGIDDDESVPLEAGLSAESMHEAGYEYAVRYDEGHWGETPRGIYYDQLTAPLITICKDQKEKIEALEARVAALE